MPPVERGLRHAMVDRLIVAGRVRGTAVERAFRTVPRHIFVPSTHPYSAYSDEPLALTPPGVGLPGSSTNQPSMTAAVLEQLAVAPGDRVLEIGSGSGYDAALLAELAGPSGAVSTVEFDPVLAQYAHERLAAAGYPRVEVFGGDGWDGIPSRAPFDRVVSSVGVWDVAPAWHHQLAPFGALVVPLWLRAGLQVSVALRWDLDRLTSTSVLPCGLARLRGRGAGPEMYLTVRDRSVCLEETRPEAVAALGRVLDRPASVLPLGGALRPGWFTALALAAPDAIQMAWRDPERGYVTASGVFDADRGGLALIVPGRGSAEMHAHGDRTATERLRVLLGGPPVRIGELRVDLLLGAEPAPPDTDALAVLRRPHVTVVVRRRG